MTSRRAFRRRAFFIVAFAWGLTAAGCSRTDGTTLRFWTMGREGEVAASLIPAFERAHPGVRVEIQQLPWSAAHEKLLTAFAGGSMPDLCQLGNTWIPEFAAIHALERLDPRVATSTVVQSSDYFPGIWDTNVVAGALYGVPWYVDTRLIFYRRDLLHAAGFDAPPRTWGEWKEMLAAVKRRAGASRFAILLPTNDVQPLVALALQQGDPLLRDDGRYGNFESDGFRRALAFYLEAFDRQWAPRSTGADIGNVWNEFGRGYFSFYISGPWNIEEFRRRLPEDEQANWMTAPLPGPDGPGASTAGGSSLVVFRGRRSAAAEDAAWQLVEYLSQPDIQREFHRLTGDLPPRRASWNSESLEGDIQARAFRDQLERVAAAPKVPEWERIASAMQVVVERAVHGDLGVAEAAHELDVRTDAILEKRRWLLARDASP